MSVLCKRMKDLREGCDKTQAEIASVIGLTRQQYHLYESGKRQIPLHHLITLADYYGVSLDYLVGLVDVHDT